MAKIRKSYLGAAASTTTSTAIASSGTNTFNISAYTGWPYGAAPYFVVLEPGTANEEKVLVTRAGATDLTVSFYTVPSVAANRGLDGTSAVAHASGSTTFPVFTATEADEANELVSTMTTKGDLLSHGTSTFARLGVGTDTYVLKADSSQATGLVWGQVAAGGLATDAVTTVKILDLNVTQAKLALLSVGSGQLKGMTFNNQTGTSYTAVLLDAHKTVTMTNASASTLTVPPNSSVAFAIGDQINIMQLGAGQVTITAGSGVTIRSSGSKLKLTGQYSVATVVQIAADTWMAVGNLSA
jgi:hypothetical protein